MTAITSVDAQDRFGQLPEQPGAAAQAGRDAVAAFRGAGRGGTVEQLLLDRRADACTADWNAVHDALGSFADPHSTL